MDKEMKIARFDPMAVRETTVTHCFPFYNKIFVMVAMIQSLRIEARKSYGLNHLHKPISNPILMDQEFTMQLLMTAKQLEGICENIR